MLVFSNFALKLLIVYFSCLYICTQTTTKNKAPLFSWGEMALTQHHPVNILPWRFWPTKRLHQRELMSWELQKPTSLFGTHVTFIHLPFLNWHSFFWEDKILHENWSAEFLASLLEQESNFLMKSKKTFHWTILWVRHIEGIPFRMC